MNKNLTCILILFLLFSGRICFAQASSATYLDSIKIGLQKKWPRNRTINLVFHGHSVPTGYAHTPEVHRLQAYPFQVLKELDKKYPYAVVNVITTSIGGENSAQGEMRFERDVLSLRPDVVFIDYALNDRAIGLSDAKRADEMMIRMALRNHIKVMLMTPSPDLLVDITKPGNILEQYTKMLIGLAKQYNVGLVDSYAAFRNLANSGKDLHDYMTQTVVHPNRKGHEVIAREIMKWF